MLQKVLIANRGEIALRILRACRDLGLPAVVAYSEADRDSLPVQLADEAVCIGAGPAAQSYLRRPAIITAAQLTGCDAIHPGYGFLAENAYMAQMCEELGITFIGPRAETIERMGDKAMARETMRRAGLPILPGLETPASNDGDLHARGAADRLPGDAQGGGGRRRARHARRALRGRTGTRRSRSRGPRRRRPSAAARCMSSASSNLPGISRCRYSAMARAKSPSSASATAPCSGGIRNCSKNRPRPASRRSSGRRSGTSPYKGTQEIKYRGAGTLEFLMDGEGRFYFMEMNTRIQVEHPVSEAVTGVDLVAWQLRIAAGEPLTLPERPRTMNGHAIECRITAEDPDRGFAPSLGTITEYIPPGGFGVRVDSHLYGGYRVPPFYDSLLGKVIVWAETRDEAIDRMRRALEETVIGGSPRPFPSTSASCAMHASGVVRSIRGSSSNC